MVLSSKLSFAKREEIALSVAGTCFMNVDYYEISDEEAYDILIEFDIENCVICGWWQYPGEYCGEHDHDDIVCLRCCEDEQE